MDKGDKKRGKRSSPKKILLSLVLLIIVIACGVGLYYANFWNLLPKKVYSAEDFNIKRVVSDMDYNKNGVDDYMDIMLGAREYVETNPSYDGSYHSGGYPPEEIGVCTDVIWNGLKHAGYSLKDMMDEDIAANQEVYWRVKGKPDKNIDFRRVPNIKVFLERYGVSLTTDPDKIEEWQPGDIVTYGTTHIAIVSDKRNRDGVPYIIHNGGQPVLEEDALTRQEISGHYRFQLCDVSCIAPWKE